jgi:TPR repeat protein
MESTDGTEMISTRGSVRAGAAGLRPMRAYGEWQTSPEGPGNAPGPLRQAAAHGFADAELELGLIYLDGPDEAQDYAEAIKWFRLAASRNCAAAQFYLGWMYCLGHGVAQDYAEARKWYRLAAEQGDD